MIVKVDKMICHGVNRARSVFNFLMSPIDEDDDEVVETEFDLTMRVIQKSKTKRTWVRLNEVEGLP